MNYLSSLAGRRGCFDGGALTKISDVSTGLTNTDTNVAFAIGEEGGYLFDNLRIQADSIYAESMEQEYVYDVLGRRVAKTTYENYIAKTTYYAYDGDQVIEELDGDANVEASYVYGGQYIDEVLQLKRDTTGDGTLDTTYYYLHDDLYNVLALTDEDGDIVERYEYGDYGAPTVYDANNIETGNESAHGNPYLFTGRRWDADTELYWYRTRYMDPALGRFISRDQIGLWGDANNLGNPFAYAGNNPWTHLDPYGQYGANPLYNAYLEHQMKYGQTGGPSIEGTAVQGMLHALADPKTTYGTYGPTAWWDGGKGALNSLWEGVKFSFRIQNDPRFQRDTVVGMVQGTKAVADNPAGAYYATRDGLDAYLSDFDAEDAGALIPGIIGLFVDPEAFVPAKGVQFVDDGVRLLNRVAKISSRRATRNVSRYTRDLFEGRNVYRVANDFELSIPTKVDPKFVDKRIRQKIEGGWTNADLMRNGNAPIGRDGRPINLHHILGDEPGPMAEILGSTHQRYHGPLHGLIENGNSFRNAPGLRSQYSAFRQRYWRRRVEQLTGQ